MSGYEDPALVTDTPGVRDRKVPEIPVAADPPALRRVSVTSTPPPPVAAAAVAECVSDGPGVAWTAKLRDFQC
jgi:hypothetical protein